MSSCGSGEGSHVRLVTVVWCMARCHCLCCRGDDASRVAAELQVPHAIVGWYQVLLARAAQVHGLVQLMQEVRPLVVEQESFQVPAACQLTTTHRGGVTTPPNYTIPHQAQPTYVSRASDGGNWLKHRFIRSHPRLRLAGLWFSVS